MKLKLVDTCNADSSHYNRDLGTAISYVLDFSEPNSSTGQLAASLRTQNV